MKIIKFMVLLGLLCIACSSLADNKELYVFHNPLNQARFTTLTDKLRCLVCQNQNLAESNAPLAADLRSQIAKMINAGEPNNAIINYLVSRYGEYILYDPPFIKSTWILWLAPFVLLVLGLSILFVVIVIDNRKVNNLAENSPGISPAISKAEQEQIKNVLAQMEELR